MSKRLFRIVVFVSTDSEDAAREHAQLIILRSQLGTSRHGVGMRSWALEEMTDGEARTLSACTFSSDYKITKKAPCLPTVAQCQCCDCAQKESF